MSHDTSAVMRGPLFFYHPLSSSFIFNPIPSHPILRRKRMIDDELWWVCTRRIDDDVNLDRLRRMQKDWQ